MIGEPFLAALLEGTGCRLAPSHGLALIRSEIADEYEFRITLRPTYALGRIPHEVIERSAILGPEVAGKAVAEIVDDAVMRLRADALQRLAKAMQEDSRARRVADGRLDVLRDMLIEGRNTMALELIAIIAGDPP